MTTLIFLLFLLLPTYLIRFHVGPVPTTVLEIIVLAIIGVWLLKLIRKPNSATLPTGRQVSSPQRDPDQVGIKSIFKNNRSLFAAIILFLGGATISIFTAVNARAALGEWRAFYLEPILIFLVLVSLKNEKFLKTNLADSIISALILSGLITSLLSIYQHFTGWLVPYSFWANRDTYRVTAWYGFPNAVGMALAPIIPLALYLIINARTKFKIKNLKFKISVISSVLFIISATAAMIYAKSIGSLVGVAAGIGTLLLFNKKLRWPTVFLGTSALLILFFVLPSTNPVRQKLLAQSFSGQLRQDIWAETSEYLLAHPIKGAGMASYTQIITPYRINKGIEVFHHPHNILLAIWVNTGLIGLIGFVWILVWFFKTALKNSTTLPRRQAGYNLQPTTYILASMVVILVSGLVDSPYIKNDLAMLFWLLPALLIITMDKKESEC